MEDQSVITILGEDIECRFQSIPIERLRYLETNPRVYSSVYGANKPDDPDELQKVIEEKMLEEPSVKKLIPRIKKHGGLQEPVLVRYDTMEVVEGNSRLAAYRYLHTTEKVNSAKWERISCQVVSALTDKQQFSYLNQVHVEGKTSWLTYEKANQAYLMLQEYSEEEVIETLSITKAELNKRVRVINMMRDYKDKNKSHFSHYNVLVRTRKIAEELETNPYLEKVLIEKIKKQGDSGSGEEEIKAQDLRDKLPSVISKKKVLKKFMDDAVTLDTAYQNARLSGPHHNIKLALEKIMDIEAGDIEVLEKAQLNDAFISAKKLCTEAERIKLKLQKAKNSKST